MLTTSISLRRGSFGSFNILLKNRQMKKLLDPQGEFLQRWNKIFFFLCVVAISLDALFLYTPLINDDKKCLGRDKKLEVAAIVIRSFVDLFYVIHIIFQFRTGFISPSSSGVFREGVLVKDGWAIAKRYIFSYFLIDIFAVLPLPQVVILAVSPYVGGSTTSLNTTNLLKYVVFFQYIPRLLRIYPLYKEAIVLSGILTETAWAGAILNLFLYMLASHVFGAFWYVLSVERGTTCWSEACGSQTQNQTLCVSSWFYCDDDHIGFKHILNASCPIDTPNTKLFDYGIFIDSLQSSVVSSTNYRKKSFYCFWWGLQNLSSLGQNLKTSTDDQEIFFAVFISVSGLLLFSYLIGNMQTFMQSTAQRLEETRVKKRDAEQWMSNSLLPQDLRKRVRRYLQNKWKETKGVDGETIICNLPKDLRRDIKRHLCLDLLKRVPIFYEMGEQLLDAMCDCLKPVLYPEDSYIVRERDKVEEMMFITRGKLLTETTDGGRTGFFNSLYLRASDFCGEELLTWAMDPHSSPHNLPNSTRTIRALSKVEGFILMAHDLKLALSQFWRLHSRQVRHTFRFYSLQWRTWAACYIQAAWRRYCRKKPRSKEEHRLLVLSFSDKQYQKSNFLGESSLDVRNSARQRNEA